MRSTEETICEVNDRLKLIQRSDGLTFGTDALLLAGYVNGKYKTGVELGSGTGIITMLLLTREKLSRAVCLEVQPEYADLTERNAKLNGLADRMTAVSCDLREYMCERECELVYTNPPYMRTDTGRANLSDKKNIARHEVHGTISDFVRGASKMLKYGGDFYAVYRTDRLAELISAMTECGLEPKRMTTVHADTNSAPSMVLIEGRRGGGKGMRVTKPLIIYKDESHGEYGEDMEYIMENGSFPDKFKV